MAENKIFTLPKLPYGYGDLEPYISEEQLRIHHQKHHQAYVDKANLLLEKMDKARKENSDLDMKSILKDFSFQLSGHILHSLFWDNIKPGVELNNPLGDLKDAIDKNFGSIQRFKTEFAQAALSVEGSGWAVLTYLAEVERMAIIQIEKHNANILPCLPAILVLDVFEHAYYLDYKNDRARFIEQFWYLVDWEEADKRFLKIVK